MKVSGILTALVLLFLFNQCSWKDVRSELPEETQEGKGTFGCKVDGRVFVPRSSLTKPGLSFTYDPSWNGGTLSIKAKYWFRDSDDIHIATTENIAISIGQFSKPGRYSFINADSSALGDYSIRTQNEKDFTPIKRYCYFEPGDTRTGILNIKRFDRNKGILSGTFEFTLTRDSSIVNCNPVVKITEGRFDLQL